jgi:hypothetical protein
MASTMAADRFRSVLAGLTTGSGWPLSRFEGRYLILRQSGFE